MSLDIVDLREFYVSPLGETTRQTLREKLARIWPRMRGETVLALGYGTPLLRPWLAQDITLLAMMPDTQGVAYWPKEGDNIACLADLCDLPLPDESVSKVVMMHALETSPDPEGLLAEVWRVLKPNGQALIIVPNRSGIWAHSDATPFGTGQPYSKSQLRTLLKNQGFLAERSWHSLFAPPMGCRLCLMVASWLEKLGSFLYPAFGGVLIMEASKHVFAPTMVKSRALGRRLVLPMPFPVSPVPSNRG